MKTPKLTGTEAVQKYISESTHPQQELLQPIREVILSAYPNLTEHIKWNAPSICYNGDDRITFNLHKNDGVLLIFHRGAKVKETPSKEPIMHDPSGLLQWQSADRAILRITSLNDLKEKEAILKQLVAEWIKLTAD